MRTSEKAKTFMFICIGLAALAVAAQQWVPEVTAQVGDNQIVALDNSPDGSDMRLTLVTAGGDLYSIRYEPSYYQDNVFNYLGNPFFGSVPETASSLGNVKSQFR